MRKLARIDANHRQLLDLAQDLGGYVLDTHQLGAGAPDAMIWSRDKGWQAVEIKGARGHLTQDQVALHAVVPVRIWRSEQDVLAHFGIAE